MNNNSQIINQNRLSNIKNSPLLFTKKIKKLDLKPLKYIYNDMGKTKHYTPAVQEWFNSIYTFNVNTTKTISRADKTLINLLKSYFNYNIKSQYLIKKNRLLKILNLNKKDHVIKIRRILRKISKLKKIRGLATRYKRLSTKRIFVGKGNLKHTNDKVIITINLYNTQRMFLLSQLRKITTILFRPKKILNSRLHRENNGKIIRLYNRPFSLSEYLALVIINDIWYFSYILDFINKLNNQYSKIITLCETIKNLLEKKLLNENEKKIIFNSLNINTFNYPNFNLYLDKCKHYYIKSYTRLIYWLMFSNLKFTIKFIEKLTRLVMNIYKKTVEFNIVSLKKMHFNSDIFTQIVSIKLRIRDNKLYRVLKASLRKVKIWDISRPNRVLKKDKNDCFGNKIRNNNIISMSTIYNKDPLNNLLLKYFSWKYYLNRYVVNKLKHRNMAGIRVEAKGRLTRRFTASRSVFKMRWKGGLKNKDSSFRGLSAIILRGYVKSNVQYSVTNSKNRIGTFGIKGWVSSK